MITGEDIDHCLVSQFDSDLKDRTIEQAQLELDAIDGIIQDHTSWAEALTAFIRLSESQ